MAIRYQPRFIADLQDIRYPPLPVFRDTPASAFAPGISGTITNFYPTTGDYLYEGVTRTYYGHIQDYTTPGYFNMQQIGKNVFSLGDWSIQRLLRTQTALWAKQDAHYPTFIAAINGKVGISDWAEYGEGIPTAGPHTVPTWNPTGVPRFTYNPVSDDVNNQYWPFPDSNTRFPDGFSKKQTYAPWEEWRQPDLHYPVAWSAPKLVVNKCSAKLTRYSSLVDKVRFSTELEMSTRWPTIEHPQQFNLQVNPKAGWAGAGSTLLSDMDTLGNQISALVASVPGSYIYDEYSVSGTAWYGPYGNVFVTSYYEVELWMDNSPAPDARVGYFRYYPVYELPALSTTLGAHAATHTRHLVSPHIWNRPAPIPGASPFAPSEASHPDGSPRYYFNAPHTIIVPNNYVLRTRAKVTLSVQRVTDYEMPTKAKIVVATWYDTETDEMIPAAGCAESAYKDPTDGSDEVDTAEPPQTPVIDNHGDVCGDSSGGFPLPLQAVLTDIVWPGGEIVIPASAYTLRDGSDAPLYPLFTGAYVYDLHLNKWGVYKGEFKKLLDYQPVNTYAPSVASFARFGIMGGILKPSGQLAIFDTAPVDSHVTYGKMGYYRQGMTSLEEVRVHGRSPFRGVISAEGSVEGKNITEGFSKSVTVNGPVKVTLNGVPAARWHNVTIAGIYDISYLEYRGFETGRR